MTPDTLARLARVLDKRSPSSRPPPPTCQPTECPHIAFGGGCWKGDVRSCGAGCACFCHTSRPKWQSDADKIRILIGECEVQARQNERAGFLIDAAEWRELQAAVRQIGAST